MINVINKQETNTWFVIQFLIPPVKPIKNPRLLQDDLDRFTTKIIKFEHRRCQIPSNAKGGIWIELTTKKTANEIGASNPFS